MTVEVDTTSSITMIRSVELLMKSRIKQVIASNIGKG